MIESAPDRLARMLALVSYLRDHPAVPVAEVADHFGISEAQVLADVNTLWVSGTPGYMHGDLIDFSGDDLEHGVLTLLDPREMDRPLRLSSGEAVALLVALQSLASVLGPDEAALLEETAAALADAAGEAARAAGVVELGVPRRDVESRVGLIRDALARGRRLHLRYVSAADQTTERDVDPLQLLTDSQHWFLVGWCHRAQDVRQFRVDRILDLQVLDVSADEHPGLELPTSAEPDTAGAIEVGLELSSRARWTVERLPGTRIVELDDGWIAATVAMVDPAWLDAVVLALGPDVRAVHPPEVAGRLRQRAQAGLDAYAALGLLDDR